MKKKDFKRQHARIGKMVDKWLTALGLKWWRVEVNYHDGGDSRVAMECWAQWQYLSARIDIYVPVVAELDDDALERTFVHECIHVLINEMREPDDDGKHEDRVCETLTKAIFWVRELL